MMSFHRVAAYRARIFACRVIWCDIIQGFITSSWDARLHITGLESGKRLRRFEGHEKSIFWCDYSPPQKLIASCGADKDIMLWNPYMDYSVMRLAGMCFTRWLGRSSGFC